jgi:hypothetical protein
MMTPQHMHLELKEALIRDDVHQQQRRGLRGIDVGRSKTKPPDSFQDLCSLCFERLHPVERYQRPPHYDICRRCFEATRL